MFDAHDAGIARFGICEREFVDKDHGRFEKRMYSAVWDVKDLEAEKELARLEMHRQGEVNP